MMPNEERELALSDYIAELLINHHVCEGECLCHELLRIPPIQEALRRLSSSSSN